MKDLCYFCGESNSTVLEEHHIVPRRFNGSSGENNLVTVCSNCHSKLEKLYDKRFYKQIRRELIKEDFRERPVNGRKEEVAKNKIDKYLDKNMDKGCIKKRLISNNILSESHFYRVWNSYVE